MLLSSCSSSLQPLAVWRRTPLSAFDSSVYGLIRCGGKPGGDGATLSTPNVSRPAPETITRGVPFSSNIANEPGARPPGSGVVVGCHGCPGPLRSNTSAAPAPEAAYAAAPLGSPATTSGTLAPTGAAALSSTRQPEPSFSNNPPL